MRLTLLACACFYAFFGLASHARSQEAPPHPIVKASLIAERDAVPGRPLTVALRQRITPGWHTYWANPGDAGESTIIDWKLPKGFSAGSIFWPTPTAIAIGPFTNYAYENEVILLTDIMVPANASGQAELSANVRWQACKDICVPEEAQVSLIVPVAAAGSNPAPSPDAALIAKARQELPQPLPQGGRPASFSVKGGDVVLHIAGLAKAAGNLESARFFPLHDGDIANSAPQKVSVANGDLTLTMAHGDTKPEAITRLEGVLAIEDKAAKGQAPRAYLIDAGVGPAAATPTEQRRGDADAPTTPANTNTPPAPARVSSSMDFWMAAGFALLGGLILNLMPCVFPVLALKAVSFATPEGFGSHSHKAHGAAYLTGVLTSFATLAGVLIALRSTGAAFGWGFQFQSPHFVLGMAALFFVLGLSLSGVFSLGAGLAGVGDDLARRQGLAGFFFTGVLATVAATPCTAPFMGTAVGYALGQPAVFAFGVLMALGLGFGAPMTLLSAVPALRRLMPRPGAWMETLKEVLAFLLYASAAWMVWVLSIQQGSDGVLAAGVALTGSAFAGWLLGRSQKNGHGRALHLAAPATALATLLFSLTLLHAGSLNAPSQAGDPEPYSARRLAELRAKGAPVFINLTAAWCITCKVNERVALKSERVARAMKDRGVSYLKGDWTNGDPDVTALLDTFDRKGVPLYLFYRARTDADPDANPAVLPQFLTESIVLGYLEASPVVSLTQVKAEH
jgi:thiol:disulfide interchange protein/DsbC/DsbD-like thiol-disulfide interchange protein